MHQIAATVRCIIERTAQLHQLDVHARDYNSQCACAAAIGISTASVYALCCNQYSYLPYQICLISHVRQYCWYQIAAVQVVTVCEHHIVTLW
jgi:hypothetical protein